MATSAAYRFTFFATRGASSEHEKSELQLAELNLYGADGRSVLGPGVKASNPSGRTVNLQQTASKCVDGIVATKWIDGGFQANGHTSVLELVLPSAQHVESYNLWTANDVVHRDPVSWLFEVRLPDGAWATLDAQEAVEPPVERLAAYRASAFAVGGEAWAAFQASAAAVAALQPTSSFWGSSSSSASVEQHPPQPQPQQLPQPWRVDGAQTQAMQWQAPDDQDDGGAVGAAALLFLVIGIFVLIAIANVAFTWRDSIARGVDYTLSATLSEEQYGSVRAKWEVLLSKWEQTRDLVEAALRELRGEGTQEFSRVAAVEPDESDRRSSGLPAAVFGEHAGRGEVERV